MLLLRYQQARIQQEQELLVRLHKERRQAERDTRNARMFMENEFAVAEENAKKSAVDNVVEEDCASKKVGDLSSVGLSTLCLLIFMSYLFTR